MLRASPCVPFESKIQKREKSIVSTCRAKTISDPRESVGNQPCEENLLWLVNVCGGEEEETKT